VVVSKQKKQAPRAPGKSFQDVLDGMKGPFPDYLKIDKSAWLGDEDIPVDRYISREIHELEKETIWKKVWQMACREEEIPEVGDSVVYDITDISILVVRVSKTRIKAYYNVCLHQGRQLRDGPSHNEELRCPFHGFCWNLDGSFKDFPSQWDFPQIDKDDMNLVEVQVGAWGGFVFINMDPEADSLEDFLGDLGMHWERFPLEDRYIAAHVAKVFPCNWKVAQEAFMEAFHNIQTHPQFGIYFGGSASESNQYDPMGNYSRALGQGTAELSFGWTPTREEQAAAYPGFGYGPAMRRVWREYPKSGEQEGMIEFDLRIRREELRKVLGDAVDELTDIEVFGGGFFTVFPNFHPWWAYDELTYRYRPYGDEPEMCIMETYVLRPFKGERPKPAPTTWLGVDESHMEAADALGLIARVLDQDEYNIPAIQKGFHNLKAIGRGLQLGTYQATKIRHFHKMWEQWTAGDNKTRGPGGEE
jgi:phenylpropionate dioxygenase-like ring-hydroxylating dioxygenase large terminal subunit